MTVWTSDELDKIAAAEELQVASLRRDGTLRNLVTIWVVRHGDDLYLRSAYGRTSRRPAARMFVARIICPTRLPQFARYRYLCFPHR
jgi:hypothetical protein